MELLVAVSVAALLLVLLVSVISRSLQLSQRSADAMTSCSSAATAIDLIATDLSSLAVTKQPFEYLQAFPETDPFQGIQPMRLMMLIDSAEDSAQPSPSGTNTYPDSGQVHAVSYLLAWQNPISSATPAPANSSIFGLYRQVAPVVDTFSSVLGTTDLYKSLYSSPGGNIIKFMPIPPALASFVAGNIVDLQVAFYANAVSTGAVNGPPVGMLTQPPVIINPASSSTPLPYQRTQILGTQTLVNGAAPALNGATYGPAVYAEISLTVLEDAGAKLWGNGTGTGTQSAAAIKQKYGHTITRKVALRTPQ